MDDGARHFERQGAGILKTRGDSVKTRAGNPLQLVSANLHDYRTYRANKAGLTTADWANRSSNLNQYIRCTTCDAQSNFVFKNFSTDGWFLQATVVWKVPPGSRLMPQGGPMHTTAKVSPYEEVALLMNFG